MAAKWVALRTAPNEPIGESWAELLRANGVASYVRRDTMMAYVGVGFTPVQVMVPEDKAEEGERLLRELLDADADPSVDAH